MNKVIPLNEYQKRLIHKAAELITTGEQAQSCISLDKVSGSWHSDLRESYAEFYGKNSKELWFGPYYEYSRSIESKNARIILLLLYAEVGILRIKAPPFTPRCEMYGVCLK